MKALLDVWAPDSLWVSLQPSLCPIGHRLSIAGLFRQPVRAAATTPLRRNDDGSANNTPLIKRRVYSFNTFGRCRWTPTVMLRPFMNFSDLWEQQVTLPASLNTGAFQGEMGYCHEQHGFTLKSNNVKNHKVNTELQYRRFHHFRVKSTQ